MGCLSWTPERDHELSRLWARGSPASAIAVEMGTSKNAVIGRVHRLGLAPRGLPRFGLASRPAIARPAVVVMLPTPPTPPPKITAIEPSCVPSRDARLAHPEYDPLTRTWFLPGTYREALTLRALQCLVGPGTRFAGYVPLAAGRAQLVEHIPPAIGFHRIRRAKLVTAGQLAAADSRLRD